MYLFLTSAIAKSTGKKIIKNIKKIKLGKFETNYFANKEVQINLKNEVKNEEVIVFGSVSPPWENWMEFLLLIHTLKKEGAKKIVAVLPYLAYMRQDKNEIQKSMVADLVAKTIKMTGVNLVLTMDIHSNEAKKLFKIPIVSLSMAKSFATKIKAVGFEADTVIAPDMGASGRANELRKILKINKKTAYFKKTRCEGKIKMKLVKGEIGKKVIIVDDILDTGKTLIECVKEIKALGAEEILIVVTHGIFSDEKWRELFKCGVKKIIVSNSIPIKKDIITKQIVVTEIEKTLIDGIIKNL